MGFMKKSIYLYFIFLLLILPVFETEGQEVSKNLDMSTMSTQNNRTCTIGRYILTNASKSSPLYVQGGIVCSSDKKVCTNGYSVMKSGVPLN